MTVEATEPALAPADAEAAERRAVEADLGGQYQIVRRLGRGAFGAVYLARERVLHRVVAVKVLHAAHARSPVERERLLREARTVAALSHPAIVPILTFGETERAAYMVMPHVGGASLADWLREAAAAGLGGVGGEGRLLPAEVRRILVEVADALAYAHAQGVLHRDLKPENVLLERAPGMDEDPPRVRLIDFGVAAFRTRDLGAGAREEVWGTAEFMAPEQAFGEPERDPRSDLYALGVLGYLMLGGRLPFDAASPAKRLAQQEAGPRQRLGAITPGAAPDLVAAIERCLAYEPAARWPRARDLRDALAAGAANDAVVAVAAPRLAARVQRRLGRVRGVGARLRAGAAAVRDEVLAGGLAADVRFALRTFRRAPAFTAAVILTLAVGLGATTAVFSAVDGLLLRPLQVADPASLVVLQEDRPNRNGRDFGGSTFTYARYLAYRTAAPRVLADLAAQHYQPLAVRVEGAGADGPRDGRAPRSAHGLITSGNYFDLLGARPALGRFYTAEEDAGQDSASGRDAARPVAVVSYLFWRGVLGGDSAALGRTLVIDGRPVTVVGVTPPGFRSAVGALFAYDVWVPAAVYRWPAPGRVAPAASDRPDDPWMNLFGRLRPGVDTAAAHAALRVILPRSPSNPPDERVVDTWVEPVHTLDHDLRGGVSRYMRALLALAAGVLLIAAANVAGMLLARAAGRRREMAARVAVGASRARVVRQLLVESTLLCVGAAVGGLAVAWAVARALSQWRLPVALPIVFDFGLDGRVLAAAALAALGAALLAGLAPALQAADVDLAGAMKDAGLASSPRRVRLRGAFVVAQVALSVVLLAMGGLFGRALRRALDVDPGFRPEGLVRAMLDPARLGYDDRRVYALLRRLRPRLLARPEIAGAAFGAYAPLTASNIFTDARRSDRPEAPRVPAQWGFADVGFVETLGTPLLAGRTFTAADSAGAPPAVVVNRTFARRLWPGESLAQVLGHRVDGLGRGLTVVGVIGDGRYFTLSDAGAAFGYVALAQRASMPVLYVRARGAGDAGRDAALQAARAELAAVAPDLALHRPTPVINDLELWRVPQRLGTLVVGGFGLIGLVVAMTGLYGVLAYTAAQRRREFGVRLALGAPAASVVRLVVRDGLVLTGLGVALGLGAALLAGRAVSGFLYGLSPADPVTFVLVPLLLGAAAVVASAIPARRAARADPIEALRAE